jgi:hypothetical protein
MIVSVVPPKSTTVYIFKVLPVKLLISAVFELRSVIVKIFPSLV